MATTATARCSASTPTSLFIPGDIVYYDKAPLAKNAAEARAKWNLMFAYGYNRNFHLNVASYFMKDDHDTLKNDCWAGQTYGDLTWGRGAGNLPRAGAQMKR